MSRSSLASTALTALLLLGGGGLASQPARSQTPPPPPPPESSTGDTSTTPVPPGTTGETPAAAGTPSGLGRSLQLPDISFIGSFIGYTSTDKRAPDRDKLRFDEGEIGIQSFVYPGIRADAFLVFTDDETVVEEAFLTVQNPFPRLPVSAVVGRRKVPFGRVNQLHPHSWSYIVQPYVLTNLVSGESLTGDGGYLSWLLPTGRVFAQLDAGFWSNTGHEHGAGHEHEEGEGDNEEGEHGDEIVTGTGAGFEDRFLSMRLWSAFPALGGDLEIGGSLARGKGERFDLEGHDTPEEEETARLRRGRQVGEPLSVRPTIQLAGLDLTWRRAGRGASRLLLRSEYVHHRQTDGSFRRSADGFYVLADQRFNRHSSLGLRYDWSEFPNEPEYHESAVSLIGTHQLTEQTYLRTQLLRGDRPGKSGFTELWFQWVWGMGPHTHSLE